LEKKGEKEKNVPWKRGERMGKRKTLAHEQELVGEREVCRPPKKRCQKNEISQSLKKKKKSASAAKRTARKATTLGETRDPTRSGASEKKQGLPYDGKKKGKQRSRKEKTCQEKEGAKMAQRPDGRARVKGEVSLL